MKLKQHNLLKALGLVMLTGTSASAMALTVTVENNGIEFGAKPLQADELPLRPSHRNAGFRGHRAYIEDYMHDGDYEDDDTSEPLPTGESVFSDVGIFEHKSFYTKSFQIGTEGTYQAILTDFEFWNPLKMVGINITTATESLGMLMEPGYFTFDADPGDYFVSFFGKAHHMGQYGIEISQVSSPVPVPGALWLFGSGLLGLAGVVRNKSV